MGLKGKEFTFVSEDGNVWSGFHRNFRRTAAQVEAECFEILAQAFPELKSPLPVTINADSSVSINGFDSIMASRPQLARLSSVQEFCSTISTLAELTPCPVPLPSVRIEPGSVLGLYEYLMQNEDLFDFLTAQHDAVVRPNGPEGSPDSFLTPAEKVNPT